MRTTTDRSLYHYTIGLPANYRHPMACVEVEWTVHAKRAAETERYGKIHLVKFIDLKRFHTVEVEKDERGVVTKILVRGPFDNDHDVCYALVPRAGMAWVIKTTWLNHVADTHSLVKSRDRYTKP